MRRKIIIAMLLSILSAGLLFSTSITSFGMDVGANTETGLPALGMYFDFDYVFDSPGSSVNLGTGTRMDVTFGLPLESVECNMLFGLLVDFSLVHNWGLDILFGPAFGVISPVSDRTGLSEGVFLGGGVDLMVTKYFNDRREIGISFGASTTLGTFLDVESSDAKSSFLCYGNVYFGFTFRTGTPLYHHHPHTIYIAI